jgi:drug/metabolite transporter (DMT)-like permease
MCHSKDGMQGQESKGGNGGDLQVPAVRDVGRYRLLGYGACALAGTLWGTGFYWGRVALDEMSVANMVLYRFLFASLGILPVVFRRRVRLTRNEWWILLITAAFGVPIQFLLQYHGLALTTVSHASLMVGAMPVLLAAAAAIFAGERLDWLGWVALGASTVGAGMVVLGGSRASSGHETPTLAGDLLVIASLIVALVWILLSKKLLQRNSAPVVSGYTILIGALMLVIWDYAPVLAGHRVALPPVAGVSMRAWIALAISGVLCTAATTLLWNWGMHHVPASRAGVFLNIEPAVGSILGVELLGEKLGPFAWLGGALIIGSAVALTARGSEAEREVILE